METRTEEKISLEDLLYLPSYANYLLQHRLNDYISAQIKLSEDLDIPLLRFFKDFSPEDLFTLAKKGAADFLSAIASNKARQQIDNSIRDWKENQLPIFKKHEVLAEDITLVTYLRKKVLLHFLPDYTSDPLQMLSIIKEIDLFSMISETALTNTFINILKEKISEDSLLIEKVNQTIPGAVYVFDIEKFEGIYSNKKLSTIIGYTQEELNGMGENAIPKLLHPDDRQGLSDQIGHLKKAKDGEIIVNKYRVKDKNGMYRWLSNHEAVFKRNEKNEVIQTIGITLDIHQEQKVSQALLENEKLHRQVEAITQLGSYTWDLNSNTLKWSDELIRMYGLDPAKDKIEFDSMAAYNHPDDTPVLRAEIEKAIEQNRPFDFYYRINPKNGTEKILHARGELIVNKNDNSKMVLGIVQDVTEKQTLIRKLERNESVYKQAEELANMGNWNWDVQKNKLEWTDQLYRIYGLEPQSENIDIDRFLSFVHPDDRDRVSKGINDIFHESLLDYTFKIVTAKGQTKILRSVAHVQKDQNGQPLFVVGTERDTTEKQTLIDKLKNSERLYKQAQLLAHVGNWSWDMHTNTIEWSEELFRIYGLQPESEVLSYERYLSFIHPEDREQVTGQVNQSSTTGEPWEFTHRVIRPNGNTRIINATGEVIRDENGKPYMMIGTAQDVTEKQGLINQLQESEKLFKQAQSLAHVGSWTIDTKTSKFSLSEEMYHIYELKPDENFDFEKWSSFILPEDRNAVLSYYDECIREKKMYDRVHRIQTVNGKIKTIHRKGELIFNDDGEVVKMVGTSQDITEEYRVQQELKENQTFIRKITDATPSIIASYNINTGKYVFISEGLEKLLGYEITEVIEKGVQFFAEIIHPDDAAQVMEKNMKALNEANADPDYNDLVVEFTYRMRHKNGHYRWFHTYGTIFDRTRDNKVEHILNISLDVTDQMEATQKIKEQEHFIQQIADASPTILYLYDVEKQSMVYTNREIFFVLGYLPDEIMNAGDSVTEMLYHPEDFYLLPARTQSSKSFQQVDSMIQYECRMKGKDDEWRWLLVREIVFKTDDEGNIKQILGAALDINRRKEMERTILQNTLLLEQSNASLEEFAYVASHDLKEPLRKISTFGDRLLAAQAEAMSPDAKIYLQKIVDASQRMQTMINDLLSISMISGNTAFEDYSLQDILNETIQTLEYKIEQQNVVIKTDPLPEAHIIPAQFRQVFQNLLSNSLKFARTDVQPSIVIKYYLEDARDVVQYQLSKTEQYHRIEFSDNGIGFENEYAGKIFAIFQRLHGRSEYEGSGIGLAICKKIVEHHGGIIYASGIPEKGASFTIILPA